MKVLGIPILTDNYCWLVIHNAQCLIIDPGEPAPVINRINQLGLAPKAILITHHHWDHTDGIKAIKNRFPDLEVIAAANEPVPDATKTYAHKDSFSISGFPDIELIASPGHTKHHCLFAIEHHLFTGDTLFSGGCGRAMESDPETLWQSLQTIKKLPKHTLLYCGHEYTESNLIFAHHVLKNNTDIRRALQQIMLMRQQQIPSLPTTLANELQINIFLMCDNPNIWPKIQSKTPITNATACFRYLRNWKNNFFSGNIAKL